MRECLRERTPKRLIMRLSRSSCTYSPPLPHTHYTWHGVASGCFLGALLELVVALATARDSFGERYLELRAWLGWVHVRLGTRHRRLPSAQPALLFRVVEVVRIPVEAVPEEMGSDPPPPAYLMGQRKACHWGRPTCTGPWRGCFSYTFGTPVWPLRRHQSECITRLGLSSYTRPRRVGHRKCFAQHVRRFDEH